MDKVMPDAKDLEAGFEPSDDMPCMRIHHCPGKSILPNGEADTWLQAIPTNNDKRFDYAGRWTKEEHDAFLSVLKMHGKDWTKVAAHVSTRTKTQTRTHAQKYFQKLSKDEVR
jgi:SHAQKYF class myb-like DNA-binding protein